MSTRSEEPPDITKLTLNFRQSTRKTRLLNDLNLSPRVDLIETSSRMGETSPRSMKRKFKLTNQLVGKGVHGNVFVAYDVVKNTEVIAKKISVKKFLHIYKLEVKILKQLEGHPNIVKILGHKVTGSSGLIFLEKINGKNLCEYVLSKDGLTEKQALNIFSDVVDAVKYMHAHNISHHDLKTENIVYDEENCVAKVVDYGLSVPFNEDNPYITSNAGSPLFAAPEVLLCLPHDPRISDVWSLGVILYFLLTMTLPWGNVESYDELVNKITNKNFVISYPEDKVSTETSLILREIFIINPSSRMKLSNLLSSIQLRKRSFEEVFSLSPSKSKTINEN